MLLNPATVGFGSKLRDTAYSGCKKSWWIGLSGAVELKKDQ
jgi:hypothetical protein